MRLLGYWILFMILIVAFIPALSLVYSPAYNIAQPCPECPECAECPTIECPVVECPECPTIECPECPKLTGHVVIFQAGYMDFWEMDGGYLGLIIFTLFLYDIDGYKYILVIDIPEYKIEAAEWIDWDTFEFDFVEFKMLNATHSYAEVKKVLREFYIYAVLTRQERFRAWYLQYFLHVYTVREDASVYDILR